MQKYTIPFFFAILIMAGLNIVSATNRLVPSQYSTIQAAVSAAVNGDVIIVADGLYSGAGFQDLDFNGKIITLRSANGADRCSIVCSINSSEPHRFALFNSAETAQTIIDGFTIIQAYYSNGGAIVCQASSPTIQNCKFIRCRSTSSGGALYLSISRSNIFNCLFEGNEALSGQGGAVYATDSFPVISSCQFSGNFASSTGGAMQFVETSATITNCLFESNTAFFSSGGAIVLNQCTNSFIIGCTMVNNYAYFGSGIMFASSPAIVQNCILWDNISSEIDVSGTGSPSITYSNILQSAGVYPGTGNINQAPQFTDLFPHDYHLSQIAAGQAVDSPCIDRGSGASENVCFTDQYGMRCLNDMSTRYDSAPDSGVVDMGYHYPAVNAQVPTPTSPPAATPTPSECSSTKVSLWMPSVLFHEGDNCSCLAQVCNATGSELIGYPLFVVLDIYGSYYFAPSFTSYDHYLAVYPQFAQGQTTVEVLPDFNWPANVGAASGITWIGVLTNPDISAMFGESGSWTFGWDS